MNEPVTPGVAVRALVALGRGIDHALAPFAPGWALSRTQRRVAREALSIYDMARRDRTTADWKAPTTSADYATIPDLPVTTARARQIARDTWIGRSAVGAFLRHMVGTGLGCRSDARDPDNPGAPIAGEWLAFQRRVNVLWRRWIRNRRLVDVEQKRSLLGMQRWGCRELKTTGEAFLMLSHTAREGNVGLVLQTFEVEQLAMDRVRAPGTGNEIRAGVEIDANGAVVAYHLWVGGHPLETKRGLVERVPAERVLPLWDLERARQTHGVSHFHPVAIKSRHVQLYDEYEVVAKRTEACIAAVRKRGTDAATWPGTKVASGGVTVDSRGTPQTQLEPGIIMDVGQDGSIDLLNPTRPGAMYDPFMRIQLGEIAAGMEMDLAMLLRDFSKANYSGQRQGLLEFWGVTETLQELMAELWLQPIWEAFVDLAIAEGYAVPPSAWWQGEEGRAACHEMSWMAPAHYWIDPAKQAAANHLLLNDRLSTHSRLLHEMGYQYEPTIDEISHEEQYAAEKNVELPRVQSGASQSDPRPGSRAGGDHSDVVPEEERRQGGNGDRLTGAVVAEALRE